jgi:transposase-like protein
MSIIDLNRRPEKREELAAWYSAALEEQATSGLSFSDYAQELGVSVAALYQWRRRLKSDLKPFGLIEVLAPNSMGPPPATPAPSFCVTLCCNRSIEVSEGFDEVALKRLVLALESC